MYCVNDHSDGFGVECRALDEHSYRGRFLIDCSGCGLTISGQDHSVLLLHP